MTLNELIEKIKSKEIQVDFGKAYLDIGDKSLEYLIDQLEEEKEYFVDEIKNVMELKQDLHGILRVNDTVADLKLHSYIMGKDYFLCLKDNLITFKEKVYKSNFHLVDPIIPKDIELPFSGIIPVKSKVLLFTNFFSQEINPEPQDKYHKKYSLGTIPGMRNLTEHMVNNGIAYGQTGNIGIHIYSNGKELILLEHNYKEINDYVEYEDEAEGLKLIKYIEENNFKEHKKSIHCGMWRWEATDFKKGKIDITEANRLNDYIKVPIEGNSIKFEHYDNSLAKSKISSFILSHFWVN